MKLIIASNNKHKIQEIKSILSGKFSEILSLSEAGIDHETVEDGATFLENSLKKAREICEISGYAALADDSGLCVDACPKNVLTLASDKINKKGHHPVEAVNEDACIGCAFCATMCPDCVITVER